MQLKFALAAAALALSAAGAHAGTVITDNFNSDTYTGPYGMNYAGDGVFSSYSPPGNTPNAASIDLVGAGTSFPFASADGDGLFIDMDGSTGNGNSPVAGALVSTAYVSAGKYTLSFDLAGNQRGSTAQTTDVGIVNFANTYSVSARAMPLVDPNPLGGELITSETPDATQAFQAYTVSFTTTGGYLAFADEGPSDQQGNLLDNINLTSAAPEPASWALMIAGVGFVGGSLRLSRRKMAVAA